jgi:hypothetical protein
MHCIAQFVSREYLTGFGHFMSKMARDPETLDLLGTMLKGL